MYPDLDACLHDEMVVATFKGPHSQCCGNKKMERKPSGRRRVFVQTDTGCVLGMELDRSDNAHTVKRKLQVAFNVPTQESSLICGDMVLKNDLSVVRNDSPLLLTKTFLNRSSSTPCLSPTGRDLQQRDQGRPIEVIGCSDMFTGTKQLAKDIMKAIKIGIEPIPIQGGLGGAYYFRNSNGENVAIVKPTDEEPYAPNNPKGFVGKALGQPGLKRSVRVGETGFREVAAYLLDHDHFANVPCTALVKVRHSIFNVNDRVNGSMHHNKKQISKIASLQQFIPHDFDASDYGTFSFPVAAVHRIGILDVRILNTDRHAGNLLVRKLEGFGRFDQAELFPIDHGLCLPESLEDPYFEWIHWPQASIPFSEDELSYIYNLDPFRDSEMLRMELPMIREACLRVLVLCTIFLKEAAAFGLCLAEIGEMMSREFQGHEEEPSELELICIETKKQIDQEELFSFEAEVVDKDVIQFELECEVQDLNFNANVEEKLSVISPFQVGARNGVIRNTLSKLEESVMEEEEEGGSEGEMANKPVENEEVVVPSPRVSQHTSKVADEKMDAGVKSSIENGEYPGSAVEYEVDGTNKDTGGVGVVLKEGNCESVSNLNRKRKSKRKREDPVRVDTSNVDDASVVGLGDCAIQQDVEVVAKTVENENREVIMEVEVLKEHQHNDSNNSNTKSDIGTAVSMKEAAEPGLTANTKRKKKKRTLSIDFKEVFKVGEAALKDETHKSDEADKERKESKDRFESKNHNYRYDVEYKDDKVTGANLDTETPAKKKRKRSKEKSEEKSLSKAKLINDFNVDISPHHDLGDLQKIKNSNDDQSVEKFNGTDPLKTIVEGKRRKGKIKSSNPLETPVLTSSRNVEEAYHSSIQKGGQEEISLSKGPDMSMGKTTIDNMETGTDAFKEGIQSTEKTTENYKNDSGIEIIAHPANEDGLMELTEDNAKNEAPQIEGAEEGREVSPENDPKLMLLDKSTPSNQGNSDAKVGGLNVTSKVVDVNGTTESIKLKKVKRKKKTAKNSDGESTFREVSGHVDASESKTVIMKSLSATNCDPKSGNTEMEENPLNQIEGGKIQQEMQGTSDKEVDFNIDGAEHTGKRQRKKSNDKKSLSNMLLKDQVLDSKDSSSSDSKTHAKSSVAVTKKSKSASTKSTKKSSKTNMEPVKDSVRLEPSAQFNSGSKDAVQLSTHSPGEKDDDNLEAPSKTLKVNADEQFSSWKQPAEANLSDGMVVDKLIETDINDIETMTRNNIHQLEATNVQTPKDLSSSQKLSSKEELDVRIHPGEKVPNAHRTGQDSKVSGNSAVIVENKNNRVNASEKKKASEKQRKLVPVSNSKLEGSIKGVQNKAGKASENNVRGAVGKTPQKKSLLSGAIFKDDSSSSSDDEVGNSGASTRTPSDNPLLSDGDSSSGSFGGRNLENGGRSSSKAGLTGTEGMSIDDVLRSSSWFKKAQAKLTASQLQESQSQSPEFVPDSLAD